MEVLPAIAFETSITITNYIKLPVGINVLKQEGIGLVPLIEEGKINTPEMMALLEQYLRPMVAERMDYLVLGYTHYPNIPLRDCYW